MFGYAASPQVPLSSSTNNYQNPSAQVIGNCTKEIDEVVRVLHSKTGAFLYLTFGQPHFRRRYLQRHGTTLQVRELGDAFHYYLYVLKMSAE